MIKFEITQSHRLVKTKLGRKKLIIQLHHSALPALALVAEELGVDALIEGSVVREGGRYRRAQNRLQGGRVTRGHNYRAGAARAHDRGDLAALDGDVQSLEDLPVAPRIVEVPNLDKSLAGIAHVRPFFGRPGALFLLPVPVADPATVSRLDSKQA